MSAESEVSHTVLASQKTPPLLVQYLFGASADTAWSTAGEQLRQWSECFEAWAEELRANHIHNTSRQYLKTWRVFSQSARKPPWEVEREDIDQWSESLVWSGMGAGSIMNELCALSSFYQFARRYFSGCRGEAVANPAETAKRPRSKRFATAGYLDEQEAQALLEAAGRGDSLLCKRDYAFYLCNLSGELNYTELRLLKWGQLSLMEGIFTYLPRDARLPEECSEAIGAYLKDSGRWEGMSADEFVFAPLKGERRGMTGLRKDWDGSRPVDNHSWMHCLKMAASWAGLRGEAITFFTLRNTAIFFRMEAGLNKEQIAWEMNYSTGWAAQRVMDAIGKQEKLPLWAEPDPERQNQRHPKGGPAPEVRMMILAPASPEEVERQAEEEPGRALEQAAEREREMKEELVSWMQMGVEDSQSLFAVNRAVNRSAARIKRMAPAYKKYQEYEAKEAAERKRIMDLVARMEAHQRGEKWGGEEEESEGYQ